MFVTFVIGLREGLEAALIVGIIAGFVVVRGDRRALRQVFLGVAAAVLLSLALALTLLAINRSLPFRQREMMEGVLALVAAAGVAYMIVWMRRNGRLLRSNLELRTASALAKSSVVALVVMAFLAVIREGLETAIFLLATLTQSGSAATGGAGAALGILVASFIGYGIYRGSRKFDLARFFTVTSVVLVVVVVGLVVSAVHEFAEAGVISSLQQPAIDLSGLLSPGSLRASLLTAFLGLQPVPTYAEMLIWTALLVVLLAYVLWPQGAVAISADTTTPAATT